MVNQEFFTTQDRGTLGLTYANFILNKRAICPLRVLSVETTIYCFYLSEMTFINQV